MEILERYELILNQALEELAGFEVASEESDGLDLEAMLAPVLGDILYRLAIEHGVAFTPFRETVLALITETQPHRAVAGPRNAQSARRPFAADLADAHGLIILALEMMPPDAPY